MDNGLDFTGLRNVKPNSALPFAFTNRPKPRPQNPFSLTQGRNQTENVYKLDPRSASEGTGRFALTNPGVRTRVKNEESDASHPNGSKKPQTSLFSSLIRPKQQQPSVSPFTNQTTSTPQIPFFTGLVNVAVSSNQGGNIDAETFSIRDESPSPAPVSSPPQSQAQSNSYSKPLSYLYSQPPPQPQSNSNPQSHPSSHAYIHPTQSQEMLPPPPLVHPRSRSRSHSRPRSTSFHNTEANDADTPDELAISEIMMRRAREAKMIKADLADQRRESASLQAQLTALTKTNTTLNRHIAELEASKSQLTQQLSESQQQLVDTTATAKEDGDRRVETIKAVARNGLDECGKNYSTLHASFNNLKEQYDSSQNLLNETLEQLIEVRKCAREGMKAVEPLLDENARYALSVETKAVMDELRNDCSSAQQVIDLLRDKLHVLSAQLAEAKERVRELEVRQIQDGGALERTSLKLVGVGEKVADLADRLATRERESIDVLLAAENSEVKLSAAHEKIKELTEQVHEENVALKAQLAAQETTLAELSASNAEVHAQEKQLCVLKTKCEAVEGARDQLRDMLQASETRISDAQSVVEKLRNELQVTGLRESVSLTKNEQLLERVGALEVEVEKLRDELRVTGLRENVSLTKNEQLADKIGVLEVEVEKARREAGDAEDGLHKANTRYLVLEERFEDQAVTLHLAKEHSGDLQERLVVSETSQAIKLEAASGKLNLDIAILKEQNSALQNALSELREESTRQYNLSSVNFEKTLAEKDVTSNRLLQAEERRAISAEREAGEAMKFVKELREQVNRLAAELQEARERERESVDPSIEEVEKVNALRVRAAELEAVNAALVQRAQCLKRRYKEGDLDDEEKDFVNSVIQMSQSIHEQDIVAKGNELRRRENMIISLQNKIGALESTLARLLKEKGKEAGAENQSMINLDSWMSSSPDTGVFRGPEAVQSANAASVNPMATISSPSPVPISVPAPPARPHPVVAKPSAHVNANTPSPLTSPVVVPTTKTFAKLAAGDDDSEDSEDDIPLSESLSTALGKRDRTTSPTKTDDSSRPARRLRAVGTRKPEPLSVVLPKKTTEGALKPKARKRR